MSPPSYDHAMSPPGFDHAGNILQCVLPVVEAQMAQTVLRSMPITLRQMCNSMDAHHVACVS